MGDSGKPTARTPSARPVPMKLFAAWEVDKTTPNCIPRQCSFTLTRLLLLRPLGGEVSAISIAVRMQSSKRTLRSNDIQVPSSGLLDTELDLSFSLQYPHLLKGGGGGANQLLVTLQRRKRYKNRAMLGYKTIATGAINMAEVLQRPLDRELELLASEDTGGGGGGGAAPAAVGRVQLDSLSSQPVEQELKATGQHDAERSATDEESSSSSNEERNIKQKFIALLKKFRVPDAEAFGTDPGLEQELLEKPGLQELLLDELELSEDDSGGAEDDLSLCSSTPKPSLRPFFSSATLVPLADDAPGQDSDSIQDTDEESPPAQEAALPPPTPREDDRPTRQGYVPLSFDPLCTIARIGPLFSGTPPRPPPPLTLAAGVQRVLEQLSRLLPPEESALPEKLILAEAPLPRPLPSLPVLILGSADLRAAFGALVGRLQKFCHCNARPPGTVRIGVLGSEAFLSALARLYVEQLSAKPPEWQAYLRFFPMPATSSGATSGPLLRHLCAVDNCYASQFSEGWLDEAEQRAADYLSSAHATLQLPIAEAMINHRPQNSSEEESSQVFVPFISDVKIGVTEGGGASSVDVEECLGSSPPAAESTTPPSSPSIGGTGVATAAQMTSSASGGGTWSPCEAMELQLDYWTLQRKGGAEPCRFSLKGAFRSLQVWRLAVSEMLGPCLSLSYVTREKKQKIMRLGKKKEGEREARRCQQVEGVQRLICSCRNLQPPLRVSIDGVEWTGVKFFQLSAQWQTHIKYFPIGLYVAPEPAH
ncbi:phosphofurin acidic cluster sorting protein 2-like isoform X2 [Dermacentor silvarum]|uniref:phosphofurin acidic cluster sorting protein 2-like isoform X2 n=1 Tax=Dermacentor silvarum TaxID=543639 RepID=UPI0021011BBA|nr:phosphofurin acidic cluster sorting protein 2-like isoform X2 [Dermacentor silvarum]